MDFLKEYFDTLATRIRSPITGSILVALALANWKLLYYLAFAETPAAIRLGFATNQFSILNSIVYPVVIGVLFAVALPWVNLVGAQLVRVPINRLRRMQADEAVDIRVHRLQSEAKLEQASSQLAKAKETAIIESERRLQEAGELDAELAGKLSRLREYSDSNRMEAFSTPIAAVISSLNDQTLKVLVAIGKKNEEITRPALVRDSDLLKSLSTVSANMTAVRAELIVDEALSVLTDRKLLNMNSQRMYSLTKLGFEVLDVLSSNLQ